MDRVWIRRVFLSVISILVVSGSPNVKANPEQEKELIRLLSSHLASARQLDGGYRAAEAAKEAAWQGYQLASSGMGVKVTLSASSFYTDRLEESRGVTGSTETQRSFTSNQVYITAKKPIYRRRESSAIEQAEAVFRSAEAMLSSAEYTLFGRVYLAWIEILTARDFVMISRDALDRAMVVRLEYERRLRSGDSTLDQLQLEVSRQELRRTELIQAESRLALAEQALIDIAGSNAVVPKGFTLDSAVPSPRPHTSREQILVIVEERNPELIAARYQEEAAFLEREKRRADYRPTIDLYAVVSKGDNDTASYIKDERRIGAQLSVPLYTSGALSAAVSQADAEYRRSQALTQAMQARLKTQASTAFSGMQVSLVRIRSSRIFMEAAATRAEAVHRGFLAGTTTHGELARAETDVLRSRQQRAADMLEFAQSWALLTAMTGQIDSVFRGESIPQQSLNP